MTTVHTDETLEAPTLSVMSSWPCWVGWQTELRAGEDEPTKVPYVGVGRKARANATKWIDRAAAQAVADLLPKPFGIGGVGVEFALMTDGRRMGGIDLDKCRDPETGAIEPWALRIIELFDSYTEVSPSGTGVKIFFTYWGDDLERLRDVGGTQWGRQFKREGGKHPPAIELHLGNRYFAVTDQKLEGAPDKWRLIATDTLI